MIVQVKTDPNQFGTYRVVRESTTGVFIVIDETTGGVTKRRKLQEARQLANRLNMRRERVRRDARRAQLRGLSGQI